MTIESVPIKGLLVLKPNVFEDTRGYFLESYNRTLFTSKGFDSQFLQDNESMSKKGTLRGLHFQAPPFAQGKLVRVVRGAVLDIALDIRVNSPTFGQHYALELTESNHLMFWIPEGFAHGFLALEDDTLFSYKCTAIYNKASEGGVYYDDKALGIDWYGDGHLVSDKDKELLPLSALKSPF